MNGLYRMWDENGKLEVREIIKRKTRWYLGEL